MKKLLKLFFLIIISLSVYFIYIKTNNKTYTLTSIGDNLSLGNDSFNIKNYSYIDYYIEYLKREKEKVIINNQYSNKKQTIKNIYLSMKNSDLKRIITDTDCLILTLGYNDLLEGLSLVEDKKEYKSVLEEIRQNYKLLIKEIRKYYHEKIIVIGYYKSNTNDYYINKGIKELNGILRSEDVTFIDTYNVLNNKQYFSNPYSYYPNYKGYQRIYEEIIRKDLQKIQ